MDHISPEHCEFVNDVYIPASADRSEITQEFTIMIRQNQCRDYEERKGEALPCLYTTATQHLNERNAIRRGFLGHHNLHCQNHDHPSTETRVETTDLEQLNTCSEEQVLHSSTFVTFLRLSLATTLKIFLLRRSPSPIFSAIDCYHHWICYPCIVLWS